MKSYKILVVDDQPDNASRIMDILTDGEKPYKFYQALNGEVAYKVAETRLPDLIIMDWEMPVMSGIEAIGLLKKNPKTMDIPVIMCTGKMTSSENLQTALEPRAVDFIRKPVDRLELISRTQSMLKLADSLRETKELNAMKDKFFSIVAHDLKNPFNALLNLSNMLIEYQDRMDSQKQQEYIQLINQSAQNTYSLLENLLTWSRSQLNKISFNPESFSLHDGVQGNIFILQQLAEKKEIQIYNQVEKTIVALGDSNMVNTIFRNLISNAIKFTPSKGSIIIDCKQNPEEKMLEVSVSDTGVGIDPKNIEKLFRIDESYSTSGTENEEGTGLGLVLCKEFVEKNSGRIWVESEVGKGTTFWFSLPISETELPKLEGVEFL